MCVDRQYTSDERLRGISRVRANLPINMKINDFAEVCGAFAGCSRHEVKETLCDGLLEVYFFGDLFDGEKEHICFLHVDHQIFATSRSTAFWIALMTKVIGFFGGSLDYNDWDDKEDDYVVPVKECFNDGLNILPVTKEEWLAANEFAFYKCAN